VAGREKELMRERTRGDRAQHSKILLLTIFWRKSSSLPRLVLRLRRRTRRGSRRWVGPKVFGTAAQVEFMMAKPVALQLERVVTARKVLCSHPSPTWSPGHMSSTPKPFNMGWI